MVYGWVGVYGRDVERISIKGENNEKKERKITSDVKYFFPIPSQCFE